MSIWSAIGSAESAMNVHRYRSIMAAENAANTDTPGYRFKTVILQAGNNQNLRNAQANGGAGWSGPVGAMEGAVRVGSVHEAPNDELGDRQRELMAVTQMIESKAAFELAMRSATLLKSLALSSLEIGRGQ